MPRIPQRAARALLVAAAGVAAGVLLLLPACGRKTPVRPPEYVAPETVSELRADNTTDGVRLEWARPRRTADGESLSDLDAFVIERAAPGEPFVLVTRVQVPDRDRLRQRRRFTYVDGNASLGEAYRYRILATTVDGYFSAPSEIVEIVRVVPSPTATAAPTATVTPLR